MYATVLFDTKKIIFEVLESPISNLWMDSLNRWNTASTPIKLVTQSVPYTEASFVETPKHIVDKIYEAVNNINQLVEGEKFPYIPYLGMPWEQTNLLHRCFTTSMGSMKCWKHNFTTDQLLTGKIKTYASKSDYLIANTKQTFTVNEKDSLSLRKHLSSLNKWVHFFESTKPSLRAVDCFKKYPEFNSMKYGYAELEWDAYDEYGQRTMLGLNFTSYKDILETFNNPKSDECDVFLSKAIMGKDYETSYFQFDDPLEIDTTNVDIITGGIRIFNKVYYDKLFGKNGAIINWTRERGLPDAMVRQIPIGKIIHSEVNFENVESSLTENYTCGAPRAAGIFSSPHIFLSEKLDNK